MRSDGRSTERQQWQIHDVGLVLLLFTLSNPAYHAETAAGGEPKRLILEGLRDVNPGPRHTYRRGSVSPSSEAILAEFLSSEGISSSSAARLKSANFRWPALLKWPSGSDS